MAHPTRTTASRGFTVTELLVVISIIAIIIAIILVTIKPITLDARAAACGSNQRSIVLACISYAADQKGRLPSPRTDQGGVDVNGATVKWPWVAAYGSNVAGGVEKDTAMMNGKLWPYLGSLKVYKSPLDPVKRHRSYSLSAFIGVSHVDELNDYNYFASSLGIPLSAFSTLTMTKIRKPEMTLYSIIEDDSVGPNNQGWVISPVTSKWVDWPATWYPKAIPIAYCDGSWTVYGLQRWKEADFMEAFGHNYTEPIATAVDWKWFQLRLLPGIIPGT